MLYQFSRNNLSDGLQPAPQCTVAHVHVVGDQALTVATTHTGEDAFLLLRQGRGVHELLILRAGDAVVVSFAADNTAPSVRSALCRWGC